MPQPIIEQYKMLTGHQAAIYALEEQSGTPFFFSADGSGMIVRWDLRNTQKAEVLARIPANVFALRLDDDSQVLWAGTHQGVVYPINIKEKQLTFNPIKFPEAVFDFLITPKYLLALGGKGNLFFLSKETGELLNQKKISNKSLRSVIYIPSIQQYIIGSSDHNIYCFDLNLNLIQILKQHQNSVFSLTYTNQHLISGARDAHLGIWIQQDNKWVIKQYIPAHLSTINALNFLPNQELIVSAGRDKAIKFWDSRSFQLLKVINNLKSKSHTHSINTLLWKADSLLLLSGGDDRNIYLWTVDK